MRTSLIWIASGAAVVLIGAALTRTASAQARVQGSSPEEVFALETGDFTFPRFSPSGDTLAASQVLREDGYINAQVILVDMTSGDIDTVLSAPIARRYGYYGSIVTGIEWRDNAQLAVTISDGDVEATVVTVAIQTHSILGEEHIDPGVEPFSPYLQAVAERLCRLHPALGEPSELSPSVLRNRPLIMNDTAVIVQFNETGRNRDIWLYSLTDSASVRLLPMPYTSTSTFGGGAVVGDAATFVVGRDSVAEVYVFEGRLPPTSAARFPKKAWIPDALLRHKSAEGAWFMVNASYPPYDAGDNPVFRFDGAVIVALDDIADVHDFDVHVASGKIAFAYWTDGRRNIVVRQLHAR